MKSYTKKEPTLTLPVNVRDFLFQSDKEYIVTVIKSQNMQGALTLTLWTSSSGQSWDQYLLLSPPNSGGS